MCWTDFAGPGVFVCPDLMSRGLFGRLACSVLRKYRYFRGYFGFPLEKSRPLAGKLPSLLPLPARGLARPHVLSGVSHQAGCWVSDSPESEIPTMAVYLPATTATAFQGSHKHLQGKRVLPGCSAVRKELPVSADRYSWCSLTSHFLTPIHWTIRLLSSASLWPPLSSAQP